MSWSYEDKVIHWQEKKVEEYLKAIRILLIEGCIFEEDIALSLANSFYNYGECQVLFDTLNIYDIHAICYLHMVQGKMEKEVEEAYDDYIADVDTMIEDE